MGDLPEGAEEFEKLFDETSGMIYNLGLRLFKNQEDALDFSQDVFLRAYAKLDSFEGRSKFSTWLYSLALNMGLKKIKKDKRLKIDFSDDQEAMESLALEDHDTKPEDPFDQVARSEISEKVQEELNELPEVYRLPLVLLYFEKLTYPAIAAKLGLKEGTLKSYIHRGKKILSKQLQEVSW